MRKMKSAINEDLIQSNKIVILRTTFFAVQRISKENSLLYHPQHMKKFQIPSLISTKTRRESQGVFDLRRPDGTKPKRIGSVDIRGVPCFFEEALRFAQGDNLSWASQ